MDEFYKSLVRVLGEYAAKACMDDIRNCKETNAMNNGLLRPEYFCLARIENKIDELRDALLLGDSLLK